MDRRRTRLSRQVGKSLSSDGEARMCRPIVYLSREKREKGEIVSTFSHVCLALRTWCLFCRQGVRGGTKFRAHAWTFLSIRWWSHHRRTRVNYYWFRMTTSALTWSSNARSKHDMHTPVSYHPVFRIRRFGTLIICRKQIREVQKIVVENIVKSVFKMFEAILYINTKRESIKYFIFIQD